MFLGRFVLDLSANTCQTHHVTLRPWPLTLKVMALVADCCSLSSCSVCVPSLNFVGIPVRKILHIYCVSISRPCDLDLRSFTLKLVHIMSRGIDNLRINFGVTRMLHSRLYGQHLSDASRDLATLTFALGGHGACRWWASSCSICLPSLKFVGLPVRKILCTSGLSISRPGDLDLWPQTLKLVHACHTAKSFNTLPGTVKIKLWLYWPYC